MSWRRALAADQLWQGEMQGVTVAGRPVLLVHLDDGVHAYEDRCRHLAVPLSEGRLEGHEIVCRAHEWRYDAVTGCGCNPENVGLRGYPVKLDGGIIYVDVDREGR